MSQTENYEHYTPQHPLPEEIREMEHDDTVCKYCGVSYLIHNEIKALEEKLKRTEHELERFRGCEQRELELKDEVRRLLEEKGDLMMTVTANDAVISTLKNNLANEEDGLERLMTQKRILEEKHKSEVRHSEILRMKHSALEQQLPRVMVTLKEQRQALHQIHDFIAHRDQQMTDDISIVLTTIGNVCLHEENEKNVLKGRISDLERENLKMSTLLSTVNEKNQSHEEDLAKMNKYQTENKTLLNKCRKLEINISEMKSELEQSVSKCRNLTLETQQFRDQLKNKTSEVEEITGQMRKKDHALELTIQKLQSELKKKEADVEAIRKELKNFERKYNDELQKREEVHRKATLNVNETRELKEYLEKAKIEIESLKSEREVMISSHQNRIEQLRESFRQKISEADQWPETLEEALRKERAKHAKEMSSLEENLKENFVMEIQIEKQKYQELLQKYQLGNKDEEAKLKMQLTQLESKYRCEIKDLQKILTDTKNRAIEVEDSLRKEIESLKAIIRNLENRLARLDAGNDDVVLALKQNLQETHSQLEESRNSASQYESQLTQAKEEIHFLQETVKRECEERFELTEALSEARENLLHLKRPAGGYMSTQRPNTNSAVSKLSENSQGSRASTTSSIGSDGSISKRLTALTSSGQARQEQTAVERDAAPTNNNTMTFQGQSAKDSGKLKGNSLSEHRRRIAAILGRKT